MKRKKIILESIEVKSFVITINRKDEKNIKGGQSEICSVLCTQVGPNCFLTVVRGTCVDHSGNPTQGGECSGDFNCNLLSENVCQNTVATTPCQC